MLSTERKARSAAGANISLQTRLSATGQGQPSGRWPLCGVVNW